MADGSFSVPSEIIDRKACLEWYRRNRRRSAELFDLVSPEAYSDRPIPLRNPICFYEGHLPAFAVNTLLKRALGKPGIDAQYEVLFERGIDPEDASAAAGAPSFQWPSRKAILDYGERAAGSIARAIEEEDLENPENPALARGLALFTVLEHDPMHHETLCYMWHRLAYQEKSRPSGVSWLGGCPSDLSGGRERRANPALPTVGGLPSVDGSRPPNPLAVGQEPPQAETVRVPAGRATLGVAREEIRFGWDNEFPSVAADVPAFEVDVHNVMNQDFLEFVEAGGYRREELWDPEAWAWLSGSGHAHPLFWEREQGRWLWRGMFERVPLPMAWPVYVTHAEASAFARWKRRRLPTEAEFHRAAYGTPSGRERSFPWGEEPPDSSRGNFDFQHWDPQPAGSYPDGRSAWGVHDLVGNGWEWTSTVFAPFPGFIPMVSYPQYSAEFFDGKHHVLKGASPATPKELVRRSFRNWFRPNYPYVYAAFRCVT